MSNNVIFEETRNGVTYKVDYNEDSYPLGMARRYRVLKHERDGEGWSVVWVGLNEWKQRVDGKPVITWDEVDVLVQKRNQKIDNAFPGTSRRAPHMPDQELFELVVKEMQARYPRAEIEIRWDIDRYILWAYGNAQYCTTGYNALYNIKELTKVLRNELL